MGEKEKKKEKERGYRFFKAFLLLLLRLAVAVALTLVSGGNNNNIASSTRLASLGAMSSPGGRTGGLASLARWLPRRPAGAMNLSFVVETRG